VKNTGYVIRRYDTIYLSTAIGFTLGGSITVHIYIQTIHITTQITTNLEECRQCPVFVSFTLEFALQLRKKHGKTSTRVAKEKNASVHLQYLAEFYLELSTFPTEVVEKIQTHFTFSKLFPKVVQFMRHCGKIRYGRRDHR
jgi:hypothetical protein